MRQPFRNLAQDSAGQVSVFLNRQELVKRVEAATRLTRHPRAALLQVGDLHISQAERVATWRGHPLQLSPKEFDILALLAEYPGLALSRTFLFDRIWSADFTGEPRLVDGQIMHLRHKLADGASLIETVRGVGYRLVPE